MLTTLYLVTTHLNRHPENKREKLSVLIKKLYLPAEFKPVFNLIQVYLGLCHFELSHSQLYVICQKKYMEK